MFKKTKVKRERPSVQQTQKASRFELSSDLVNMFLSLQEKLNSPVFNGGFDQLYMKIESIEETQKEINSLVASINKTIYEPDEGLFSRIKKAETENKTELQHIFLAQKGLKDDVTEMKDSLKKGSMLVTDFNDLKNQVDNIIQWRNDMNKKLWIIIPIILSLLGKVGFDFIIAHIALK